MPSYSEGRVAVTAVKDHLADVQKIQRAMRAESRNDTLERAVRDCFWVLASNKVTGQQSFRPPGRVYLATRELTAYFDGNQEAWFAQPYPDDLVPLLTSAGVAKSVRIARRMPGYDGDVTLEDSFGCHVKGVNGFDPDCQIDGLEHAIKNVSLERAKYLWNTLLVPNWKLIRGTVLSSTRQGFPHEATEERYGFSTMGKLVAHKAWIPTKNNRVQAPFKLELRLLPEGFERDRNLVELFEMQESSEGGVCDEATKLRYANALGINLDVVEAVKSHPEVIEVIKHNLRDFQEWMRRCAATELDGSDFPERTSRDSERRAEKLKDDLDAAPDKEYEVRERRVRISAIKSEHTTWLREQYTRNDRMFCQVCQREMPFRKRDGKDYFEAVESFTELGIEHRCLYLALCPLCAAKYKEFVKREPHALARFRAAVIEAASLIVPVCLGDEEASVRFVQTHLLDLRTSLQHCGASAVVDRQVSEGTTSDPIASGAEGSIAENALQQRLRELKQRQATTAQSEAGQLDPAGPMILGVRVPSSFENVRWGCKFHDGKDWILTTRRGYVIAKFPSESKLDEWWVEFQRQAGRSPEQLTKGSPQPKRLHKAAKTVGGSHATSSTNASNGDYMRPWSERYGMPEYDLE